VHLDVVAWRTTRGFIGDDAALGRLIAELRARRDSGDETPVGVLTHHLVMDSATEDFLARLSDTVVMHRAARWVDTAEMLAAP